jgi:hypothetical protein
LVAHSKNVLNHTEQHRENSKTGNKLECLPFPSKQKERDININKSRTKIPEACLEKRVF